MPFSPGRPLYGRGDASRVSNSCRWRVPWLVQALYQAAATAAPDATRSPVGHDIALACLFDYEYVAVGDDMQCTSVCPHASSQRCGSRPQLLKWLAKGRQINVWTASKHDTARAPVARRATATRFGLRAVSVLCLLCHVAVHCMYRGN